MAWRDPAAWRADPGSAAQAAATEAKSTAHATVAQVSATAQSTAAQVSTKAQSMISDFEQRTVDRPELRVGAVFAGGLLAALILRRLAR